MTELKKKCFMIHHLHTRPCSSSQHFKGAVTLNFRTESCTFSKENSLRTHKSTMTITCNLKNKVKSSRTVKWARLSDIS